MLFKCATHAPATDHGHRQTVTDGKKHFAVDIHCHIHVPAADAMVKAAGLDASLADPFRSSIDLTREVNGAQAARLVPKLTDPAERIADMDACGVDVQAISPSPFHYNYWFDADFARDTAKVTNDRVAEICGQHPDRFVGLCTVPLQNADMAVAELDRCVNDLGMRGVEISTNVNGKELTRAGLEKFFARVEELGVVIFMHPHGTTFTDRFQDHYFANTIGHPLESMLAAGHLVFDGYLDTYPGLKICIAHGGGYISHYWGRFDHPWERRDDVRQKIDKHPRDYIAKLYFDTVTFSHDQLNHLVDSWGADHVLLGTDYPYDMAEEDPVGFIASAPKLTDDQKALVTGGNAARLLGIEVPADA
jgi:aminocarboxymuconate-semialdehyde decarboxylase